MGDTRFDVSPCFPSWSIWSSVLGFEKTSMTVSVSEFVMSKSWRARDYGGFCTSIANTVSYKYWFCHAHNLLDLSFSSHLYSSHHIRSLSTVSILYTCILLTTFLVALPSGFLI